jgi:thioredoxin 1
MHSVADFRAPCREFRRPDPVIPVKAKAAAARPQHIDHHRKVFSPNNPPQQAVNARRDAMGAAQVVTDADFDATVLQSTEPVLVDFFAEWCGPCKAMAPALEQIASEMAGKIKVVKIDVDASPTTTQKYKIQAMPTLIMFNGGKEVNRNVGALVQKIKLESWVKSAVAV